MTLALDVCKMVRVFLHIMIEDKHRILHYHINQINSHWPYSGLHVLNSDKLPAGVFRIFPTVTDEKITPAVVKQILTWYYDCTENSCMTQDI